MLGNLIATRASRAVSITCEDYDAYAPKHRVGGAIVIVMMDGHHHRRAGAVGPGPSTTAQRRTTPDSACKMHEALLRAPGSGAFGFSSGTRG